LSGVPRHREGVRHWQQIMSIPTIDTSPTEMIGKRRGLRPLDQPFQPLEVFPIKLVRRTEVNGYSMLDDSILFQNLIEYFKRSPAIDYKVFGNDLEPVYYWLFSENVPVVGTRRPIPIPYSV
jgi:hypothetical protein